MKRSSLSEEAVRMLPAPASGAKVNYFAGEKLQGKVAPSGFGVRVTKAGAKSFVLNYRVNSRERRYTIGKWKDGPQGGGWSVIAAIDEAMRLRREIDKGHDPQGDKERVTPPSRETVSAILDDFVARYVKNKERPLRSADGIERALERLVKPRIGKFGIYEVRRSHVAKMLDEIEDSSGPVMADRVLAYVRKGFSWYAARDDEFNSPIVRGMARTKPKERARKRILSDDEIRDLWAALDKVKRPSCYPRFVRALLLTAQRRDEVAKACWKEVDGEIWVIPAERYKTKVENAVPLSKAARDVFGTEPKPRKDKSGRLVKPGPFVFSTTDGHDPFSGYSKAKRELDAKISDLREKARQEPIPNWTLHDLRRSARSLMSRAGVPGDIAERVLGHVIAGVRGTYDRYEYLAEKRDALERLAGMVERILNPPKGNVTDLRSRKKATR